MMDADLIITNMDGAALLAVYDMLPVGGLRKRDIIAEIDRRMSPPAEPGAADVEAVAELVYESMREAANYGREKPPKWVEGGNAIAQDEARKTARKILARLLAARRPGPERTPA